LSIPFCATSRKKVLTYLHQVRHRFLRSFSTSSSLVLQANTFYCRRLNGSFKINTLLCTNPCMLSSISIYSEVVSPTTLPSI
jgi:hypothetical protein